MTALAEKLRLNKKQVSNFFERERRKANIVIESRRKGANAGESNSGAESGDSASIVKQVLPSHVASKPNGGQTTSSGKVCQSDTVPTIEPIPYYNSTKRPPRGPQLVKRDSFHQALESDRSDAEDCGYDENQDAEGEPDFDADQGMGDDEDEDMFARYRPSAEAQNPLVHKNKAEQLNRPAAFIASQYASRNARYASRSPLYAFPAAHTLDNFRTAPKVSRPRAVSTSPSLQSRSSSPLVMTGSLAVPSRYVAASLGYSQDFEQLKRKRGDRPVESPTVLFLRNPFPTPLNPTDNLDVASVEGGEHRGDEAGQIIQELDSVAVDNQPTRKRARVWFSKPAPAVDSADSASAKSASVEEKLIRVEKPARAVASDFTDMVTISEARPARMSTRRTADAAAKAMQEAASERDGESSDESAYGDNDDGTRKRDNRPGAALRSTIACTELRQSFLSNPHPPTAVLESLAIRLGLGKKQVSNYFVRERKKAGYTIKVRHGLQRKRNGKKKVDKPAVVVTQHDQIGSAHVEVLHQLHEEEEMSEEEEDCEDGDMSSELNLQSQEAAVSGRDDVPELGYDDQDGSSLRSETLHMQGLALGSSALMVPSRSLDSMTTASRQEEEDEIASPPFQSIQLLSAEDLKSQGPITADMLATYGGQVTAAPVTLGWL